ncbi:MAG: hypothetical protein COA41_19945 [Sphingopyxis sp.]|nr:MAG: hypothetical protein COA41_19945 [Sphingopyxis sp.]
MMKAGMRFKSAVCSAEGVVVRAAEGEGELTCGGTAVTLADQQPVDATPLTVAQDGGALLAKRYVDTDSGLEVLCSKAGFGLFAFAGRQLTLKQAKALPASD